MLYNIKTILVPTDFSECAQNATEYACRLATYLEAQVILVHAYDVLVSTDLQNLTVEAYITPSPREAERRLNNTSHHLALKFPLISINTEVVGGELIESLETLVHKRNVDLVVMGTKGAKSFTENLLGTNTADVFTRLKVPVWVIPTEAKFISLEKIVYATNFEYEDLDAIAYVVKLAEHFNSKINIVHVSTQGIGQILKDDEIMDWFKDITQEKIPYSNFSFNNITANSTLLMEINNLVVKEQANLLVMSTKGKGFWESLLTGSLTKRTSYMTKTPLLVYHLDKKN